MVNVECQILNAERALASLEDPGAALNGIAGGNGRYASRSSVAALLVFHSSFIIHHSSFIIQNSKFKIQNSKSARLRAITFPELMGFLRDPGAADLKRVGGLIHPSPGRMTNDG
jgi:hypothetical protein